MAVKVKTYVDACVIIAAATGTEAQSRAALEILDDPNRLLVASKALELEVLPPAQAHGFTDQADFARAVLQQVEEWVAMSDGLFDQAIKLAGSVKGLIQLDAIHAVAAREAGAVFVTTERQRGPFSRVPALKTHFLPEPLQSHSPSA